MPIYSPKTGNVWIRDYDLGVVLQLGAILDPVKKQYSVHFTSGLSPNTDANVPVILNNPEQVYEKKTYPSLLIKREPFGQDRKRWGSYGQFDYVSGVPGTEQTVNGQTVYHKVEIKPQAWPYTLNYTVTCFARYEYEAQTMMRQLLRSFQPLGQINVTDSLGENRGYVFYNDSEVQDIGEFINVAERVHAYSISIRIEAEIDLVDPQLADTVQTIVGNTGTM